MRHVSPSAAAFAALPLLLAAGCKVKDPLYCDPSTPCTDPERPYCDDDGAYPASDGIKHTCIPYPWDAAPSADAGPSCTPGEWTLDTIDNGNVEAWPNLVVDASGMVHVAYAVGHPPVLHYARGRAGSWHLVETPEAGGFYPQMAIDSSDTLHLVHGGFPGGLRYLHKGLPDDEFEYELAAVQLAYDIGFALDSSEEPVACFFDGDSGGVPTCYEHTADGWQSFESPRPESTGGISIAIDSSNTLHFVADGVIYFSRQGGEWSAQETATNTGTYPPVAVDSDGVPHVLYPNDGIVHAYRVGPDEWIKNDRIEGAVDGDAPALFIDRNDVLHVAYVDATNSNLKYARKDGDSWSTKTIDATATIPQTPKLYVDANGTPHIVYSDGNDEDLRYAYLCP